MLSLVQGTGLLARWAWLGVSLFPSLCPQEDDRGTRAPEAPFQLAIAVTSDPGQPVPGARILLKTNTIGSSDAEGLAKVEVPGNEGDSISLLVQCPDNYTSPDHPIVTGLRRLAPGSPPP